METLRQTEIRCQFSYKSKRMSQVEDLIRYQPLEIKLKKGLLSVPHRVRLYLLDYVTLSSEIGIFKKILILKHLFLMSSMITEKIIASKH